MSLKHGDRCPSARTLRETFGKHGFSLRAIVPEGKKLAPDERATVAELRVGFSYAPERTPREGHAPDRTALSVEGRSRTIESIAIGTTGITIKFYVGDPLSYSGHEGFARHMLGTLTIVEGLPSSENPVCGAAALAARSAVAAAEALSLHRGTPCETPRDDLKRIRGIGVLIEKKLNAVGVATYAQIARWNESDLTKAAYMLGFDCNRIAREMWVEQARILASGATTGFSRHVDRYNT